MPIPKPTGGETEQDYVSRCISEIYDEYGQEQSSAICYATYEKESSMSAYTSNRIKAQMSIAKKDAESKGILLADYPWDECIADQMERYGEKGIAERICGYIKSEYGG